MSDIGDAWRDLRQERKLKKLENSKNAYSLLDEKKIPYEVKNHGIHLVVDGNIDYWPSTGKFIVRGGNKGRGIFNLIKEVQK